LNKVSQQDAILTEKLQKSWLQQQDLMMLDWVLDLVHQSHQRKVQYFQLYHQRQLQQESFPQLRVSVGSEQLVSIRGYLSMAILAQLDPCHRSTLL
jgi:hypothetical protein